MKTMRESRGRSSEMSLRLCSRAPRMMSFSCTCESSISGRVRSNKRSQAYRPRASRRAADLALFGSLSRPADSRVQRSVTRDAMPDPQLLELLDSGTRRLVRSVDAMTDDQWRAAEPAARLDPRPRGRAPDPERRGAVRCARGGARGRAYRCTPPTRRRDGDIAELAAASAVRAAGPVPRLDDRDRRVGGGARRQPGRAPSSSGRPAGDSSRPRDVGDMRAREVEIHHADLALDYTAADWAPEFVVLLLDSRAGAGRTTASRSSRTPPTSTARGSSGPAVPRCRASGALWHGG